jgi:uncharacterized protein YxjI
MSLIPEEIMVDKNRLMEELRNLKQQIKSDPRVMAKYDLDGNGEISGEEWELARKAVIASLEAAGPSQKQSGASKAAMGASTAGAALGGAASQVFGRMQGYAAGGEDAAPEGTLLAAPQVIVRQEVERLELLTSFEGRNRYGFYASNGHKLAHAEEDTTGIMGAVSRNLFSNARAFTMGISVIGTAEVIGVKRHFELIFSRIKVSDAQGPVGEVNQRFSLLTRKYDLVPYFGSRKLIISGPLLRPWTFNVMAGTRRVGSIKKKWSGLLKEAFTKSDNFEISIDDPGLSAAERKLVFAAAIAIDIDYFEKKKK